MVEEIEFENHHVWNVTLTLTTHDLESHIVVNVSLTLTNTTIWFVAALCFIVDVQTYRRTFLPGLLGHLLRDDLKIWWKQTSKAWVSIWWKTVVSINNLCVDSVERSGFLATSSGTIATTVKSSGGLSSMLLSYVSAECGWYSSSGSTVPRGTISSASTFSPNGYAALYSLAVHIPEHHV